MWHNFISCLFNPNITPLLQLISIHVLSDHQSTPVSAITEPFTENLSSLHLARAGLMYLYGAGQLSSHSYTAQGTAQLQHIDLPLTWWPLSLLLIDLKPPIDSPACGSLIGGKNEVEVFCLHYSITYPDTTVLFQQGMQVGFNSKQFTNNCWNRNYSFIFPLFSTHDQLLCFCYAPQCWTTVTLSDCRILD